MNAPIDRRWLFRHFDGHTGPLEHAQLREWLRTEAHQELYYLCLHEWERQHPQVLPDADAAFVRLLSRLETPLAGTPEHPRSRPLWRWARLLAALVVLVGGLSALGLWYRDGEVRVATGYGEIRTLTLPDGSRVTLNANSRLTYPRRGFGAQTRLVRLVGEAEFDVTHHPARQRFVVQTENRAAVTVLGTQFTVFARPRGTRVVLSRGKVTLSLEGSDRRRVLSLKPGDWVAVTSAGTLDRGSWPRQAAPAAWKEHRYTFQDTPLHEIGTLLQENFGLTVELPDSALAARTVTGTFHARSADDLLAGLRELFGLRVEQRGQTVRLIPEDASFPPF
jgi:transmembrane sensor